MVAADQATVTDGGRPVTLTLVPVRPSSMFTSEATTGSSA
jgi:hypothetical protein